MNKTVKHALVGVVAVAGVTAAGAAYVAATFNPNDYKQQIIQAVQDSRQRTLHLDGDIKLSFFPNLGVDLGRVSLSEYRSEQTFASMETARVSLALLPLLSKQWVVNEVRVSGLNATLVKHRDGSSNIDDLLGKENQPASKAPVKFDIASVAIDKTHLAYRDEGSGAQYALKDLRLDTGRIASGVPGKIKLSARLEASQPRLDLSTQLATTLTFDLDQQSYRLADLDWQLSGAARDLSGLKLAASGEVSANLASPALAAKQFKLNLSAMRGKETFEAALSLPDLSGSAAAFKASALNLDLDAKQNGLAFKVKLASPLSGNWADQQFKLDALTLGLSATGEALPNKAVSSEMKGSVALDLKQQSVQAQLVGGLLQSQLKARVGVHGFATPAIRFDVEADRVDVDPYLPKKTAAKTPEQPFDLSALRSLDLDGSVRIGQLKVAHIQSSNVRLDVKAHGGQLALNPLSANLYQGVLRGSLVVNARDLPILLINQSITGVDVAALTRDAAGFDTLEGRGNVALNLSLQGNTVSSMKKAMNGTVSLNLADGAVKGINIAKKLRDAQAMLGKAQTQSANQSEKTDFSELKATFKVAGGVAHNDDLALKSPLLRLGGTGDIDIGQERINYLAKATLAKTLEGQGGRDNVGGITVPVRVAGPFTDLKYTLDFGAMVGEMAKQKVEAKKEEVKARVKDQLQNSLKGLFR